MLKTSCSITQCLFHRNKLIYDHARDRASVAPESIQVQQSSAQVPDEMDVKPLCVEELWQAAFLLNVQDMTTVFFCEEITSVLHMLHEVLAKTMRYEQNKQFHI